MIPRWLHNIYNTEQKNMKIVSKLFQIQFKHVTYS